MLLMLNLCLGVNQDIVNKNYHKNEILKHLVHQIHKYNRSTCQTKRHHNEFVISISGTKGSLGSVTILNPQLVVA